MQIMFEVIEEKIAVPLMLVITALVLGGIFLQVREANEDFNAVNQAPPIVKSEKKDPVKNWQTYRNEEFGFEFKYPENIEPASYESNGNNFECFVEKTGVSNVEGLPACMFELNTYSAQYNNLEDEGVFKLSDIPEIVEESGTIKQESIAGQAWVYIENPEGPGGSAGFYTYTSDEDSVIELRFVDVPSNTQLEITSQILSTFKFIEPADLSAEIREGSDYHELVLFKNEQEIRVHRAEQAEDLAASETLTSFTFSPNKNYLTFLVNGWEWNTLYVYSTAQEKIVFEEDYGGAHGFTEDEQHFYNCFGDGLVAGKGFVYEVPGFEKVFDLREALADKDYSWIEGCSYNKDKNIIDFTLIHQDTSTFENAEEIISYSFETNNLVE